MASAWPLQLRPLQLSLMPLMSRRKSTEIQNLLNELGTETLEERLQSSLQVPASPPYRLSSLIAERVEMGKTVLVYELSKPTPSTSSLELAALAKSYIGLGADALCVRTDSYDTESGTRDLFTVCNTVGGAVPVIARDWLIHPLQCVDIKEAGAAGCLGVIGQVNGRATAVLSSFAAALGLDAPVEVINLKEVEGLAKSGVVFYSVNISVGISVSLPGFSSDLAKGIVGNLPFGSLSLVGVRSLEEATRAKMNGADSLLIKAEMLQEAASTPGGLSAMCQHLSYIASGDD